MAVTLHPLARTTPRTRAELQAEAPPERSRTGKALWHHRTDGTQVARARFDG